MGQNGAVLPTPAALREQSRIYRERARRTVEPTAKREIAAYAYALAQVAEALERNEGLSRSMTFDDYKRLLAQALERAEAIVRQALSIGKAYADARAQVRAWRVRAQELRMTADSFAVPSAQETLRRMAANYDRVADHAEARLFGDAAASQDEAG